jgi:hypothetical protein
MPPTKIMLIRHGEKPEKDRDALGVGDRGRHNGDDLLVRGWQRAGALARFFAPLGDKFTHASLARPDRIYAAGTGEGRHSKRSRETVEPLADLLRLPIIARFLPGEESALAAAVLEDEGAVLVAWEHKAIAAIIAAVASGSVTAPVWPQDRYDLVLVLERRKTDWRLTQVPQMLLAGDRDELI